MKFISKKQMIKKIKQYYPSFEPKEGFYDWFYNLLKKSKNDFNYPKKRHFERWQ